jgi:lycopene cyclase domain-containing protein
MKKHLYTIIGIAIPLGPIGLSFDEKVNFIQYLWPVLIATAIVGTAYIIWDVFAVKRDHWQFNDAFAGNYRFLDLPLGEWLFFLGVPYACIFIYEVVVAYFGDFALATLPWLTWVVIGISALLIILGFLQKKGYSSWVLISLGVATGSFSLLYPMVWTSSAFLISLGLSFLAFLLINGIYVNLPTIFYSKQNFSGIRIIGIPLEDFAYNFSYIGFLYLFYFLFKGIIL